MLLKRNPEGGQELFDHISHLFRAGHPFNVLFLTWGVIKKFAQLFILMALVAATFMTTTAAQAASSCGTSYTIIKPPADTHQGFLKVRRGRTFCHEQRE